MLTLTQHRQNIEDLIAQNRIDEARDYCRRLSHPNSRLWLSQINRLFPIENDMPANAESVMTADGEIGPDVAVQLLFMEQNDTDDHTSDEKVKREYVIDRPVLVKCIIHISVGLLLFRYVFLTTLADPLRYAALVIAVFLVLWPMMPIVGWLLGFSPKMGHKAARFPMSNPFESATAPTVVRQFIEDAIREYRLSYDYFVPENPYERHLVRYQWHDPNPLRRCRDFIVQNRQDIQFLLGLEVAPLVAMLGMVGVFPTFCYTLALVLMAQGAYSIIENNRENNLS